MTDRDPAEPFSAGLALTVMETSVVHTQGMAFETELDGHRFMVDADAEFGGTDAGPRPKGLLLSALGGCTAMDVVAILQKMRVTPSRFEVKVDGDLADEHPKKFVRIRVRYLFEGQDLPLDKLFKAVSLSEERYCGVSAMLRPVVPLETVVMVNGEVVSRPVAG